MMTEYEYQKKKKEHTKLLMKDVEELSGIDLHKIEIWGSSIKEYEKKHNIK